MVIKYGLGMHVGLMFIMLIQLIMVKLYKCLSMQNGTNACVTCYTASYKSV